MTHSLHVAFIPSSVRSPVAFAHLDGAHVDDLSLLRWLYHPEQGWALGFNPTEQVLVNVRATLLARSAGEDTFVCGGAYLTHTDGGALVDVTHDLITTLNLDRFN